jgi:hypothetical protein
MVAAAAPRLAADLVDLPGDAAARALAAHGTVHSGAPAIVLATRAQSLAIHPTAERRFAVGRAHLFGRASGAEAAAAAFADGLALAPADGVAWAEYARAVLASYGRVPRALDALSMSARRAPFDPLAVRLRKSAAP